MNEKNILKVTIGLKQADALVSVYCLTVLVSLKTKKKKVGNRMNHANTTNLAG